ncbi:MAG TPA: ATP-binding protein [Candidatus Solibacter sp.]|jgi:signal transduction histidine kinase|nr:ATP-binding protein [Candidatus Solibacter sp.]
MATVIQFLNYVTAAGFVALAVITVREWMAFRVRSRLYLALAIGLLALVDVVGLVTGILPKQLSLLVSEVSIVGFMGAGYSLLLFRDTLVPLKRRTKLIVGGLCAVSVILVSAVTVWTKAPEALGLVAVVLLLGVWMGTVTEPVLRLWLVSRGRPSVQKARLRALSLGYGGILLILAILLVGIGVRPLLHSQVYQLGTELLTLMVIPLLYLSFAPPQFVRRIWRQPEEEAFASAIQELLLFSPDRETLAKRSVDWAMRLVGGDGAIIIDAGGEVLATKNVADTDLAAILTPLAAGDAGVVRLDHGERVAIAIPMPTARGTARVGVVSGPYTPLFGSDEVQRLEQYSASFLAALERVRLVESLRTSERQVSELNRDLERRVAERTAQLESSNQELEAFSYTVSHDLRAPLRAVDGFARILLDEYAPQLDSEGRRYLNQVSDNAEDMGKLIDGLLSFSRLSRQPMQLEMVDPKAVARHVIETARVELGERHVEFEVGDMPAVRSDRVLLGQVYANLIGNAIKFTRGVPDAKVEIGCDETGDGPAVFYVRDNGVGFDMQFADKLFGVFQRLHRSEEYEGTGAGLAIVQRIVHRHGGRVWAESEPGKSTVFYFTLAGDPVAAG